MAVFVSMVAAFTVSDAEAQAIPDACPPNGTTGLFTHDYVGNGGLTGAPGGTQPNAIRLTQLGGHTSPLYAWTLTDPTLEVLRILADPDNGPPVDVTNTQTAGQFRVPAPPAGTIIFCLGDAPTPPSITVNKEAAAPFNDRDRNGVSDTPISAPGTITYIVFVQNTGTSTIDGVDITDSLVSLEAPGGGPCVDVGPIPPGRVTACTGTLTVTQADIDAGGDILNRATATATSGSLSTTDSDTYVIPIDRTPAIEISVNSTGFPDTDGDGIANTPLTSAPGVVDFVRTITNTGNVTLTNVRFTSDRPGTCTQPVPATLAPGASITCTDDYPVTQAEFDAGASADDTPAVAATGAGRTVSDAAAFKVPFQKRPAITIEKTSTNFPPGADPGKADPGIDSPDDIDYRITVTNSGNVTLTGVLVQDVTSGTEDVGPLNCSGLPATLAPGASGTCNGVITVDQDRLDRGGDVINTAYVSATGAGQDVAASDSYDVPVVVNPGLSIVKTSTNFDDNDGDGVADDPITAAGDINYSFTVANTGNVTLTDVFVADASVTLGGTCGPVDLAPGATLTGCTGTRAVTAAEITAGPPITNQAFVTGTGPAGPEVATDSFVVPTQPTGDLSITKTSTSNPDGDNDGVADDPLTGPATISYELVVSNTGTGAVNGITVSDPDLDTLTCPSGVPFDLAAGATETCTGTLDVDQVFFDGNAGVPNQASASGTTTAGAPVSDVDLFIVLFDKQPSIAFSKTSSSNPDTDGDGVADTPLSGPGTIDYQLVVENTGNVTLTNPSVVDSTLGTLSCDAATSLAPGATYSCTGSYTVDRAGFDDGEPLLGIGDPAPLVANLALAGALPPGATGPTDALVDADFFVVPFDQRPDVSIEKTSTSNPDTDGDGIADTPVDAPGSIDYSMTVRNTGNVTLTGIAVSDPDVTGLSCGATTLAPGASTTCTATGTVTQADIDAGGDILNTATVTATGAGATVTDSDTYDIPIEQRLGATLTKTSTSHPDTDDDGIADTPIAAPGRVEYVITGTNTGNVDFTGVTIVDPTIPDLDCTFPGADGIVPPGGSVTCTGTLTADQALIDAGGDIINTVKATGDAVGQTFETTAAYDIPILQDPAIEATKTPAEQSFLVGTNQVVRWEITVTNSGNVTMTDVAVNDLLVEDSQASQPTPVPGCSTTATDLAPGESISFPCTVGRQITLAEFANLVVVRGTTDNAGVVVAAAGAVVRSQSPDDLPFTGLDVDRLVPTGIALLILGGAVVLGTRRRRIGPATEPEL